MYVVVVVIVFLSSTHLITYINIVLTTINVNSLQTQ